ncbi:hemerythrin subunit beta-like [Lingula anatina]|uniref:Hemerythrin subunit beta-like n=1 Tax=Lingula anatina TaxID=7574 RepID=A0A1S3HPQ8_LINAN|nr:hemerythrin subunit beta-like [Lingula anatina]|eukprot:XP_013388038.1 hemerythrin subunit beta-like [Lingula anatina]
MKIPAPFAWSPEFATSYENIDSEHRTLFNGLFALSEFNTQTQLNAAIEVFSLHFHDEQGQMKRAKFAGTKEHTDLHNGFMDTLRGWNAPVSQKQLKDGMAWLCNHIPAEDFKYKGKL